MVAEAGRNLPRKLADEIGRRNLTSPRRVCRIRTSFGGIAQLGERLVRNQKVGSSILPVSTKEFKGLASARPFSFLLGDTLGTHPVPVRVTPARNPAPTDPQTLNALLSWIVKSIT
jgi:hypothetical protein